MCVVLVPALVGLWGWRGLNHPARLSRGTGRSIAVAIDAAPVRLIIRPGGKRSGLKRPIWA